MQKVRQPTVIYQGRKVELRNFRVFVYNKDAKLLVNNYDEYQRAIKSGEWFTTKSESLIVNEITKIEEVKPGVAETEEAAVEAEKVKLVAVSDLTNKVKLNDANSKRIR